jgi:biotin carboxyl carrier protein
LKNTVFAPTRSTRSTPEERAQTRWKRLNSTQRQNKIPAGSAWQAAQNPPPLGDTMAAIEIQVPDIGDFDEVTVIELLVKSGDTVKADQSLITVESDKASMEIPSSQGGVVKAILVKLGDKVKQGSVVLSLESDAAAAPANPDPKQKGSEA